MGRQLALDLERTLVFNRALLGFSLLYRRIMKVEKRAGRTGETREAACVCGGPIH